MASIHYILAASAAMAHPAETEALNRCRQSKVEMTDAIGEARQRGAKDSPKLFVRFAPAWLSFTPGYGETIGSSIWSRRTSWSQ